LLGGRVCFEGSPADLAATAAGRVWAADERDRRALLSWRSGDNRWRHLGEHPPEGAEEVPPTVEEGYLLLSHVGDKPATSAPRWRSPRRRAQ
jgi:ABC-2 type transport system ATP-binding protein